MNAASQQRLDELARDAGRELALQPEHGRADLFARFTRIVAEENAAAIAHRRVQQEQAAAA